jgi:tetratricopeptide (TPR) repeat protein
LSSQQIKQLHLKAQKLINSQQSKAAHQACVQILALDPKHADAHFLLGMIAMNMQQMSKAIGLIEVAISGQPNNAEYYAFLARALSLVNRYQEAYTAVEHGSRLGSNKAMVNDTLGVVLSRLGEHKRAVPLFNQAISQQPNNPNLYYNLAASLKFSGEFTLAEAAYEKVISLKPDYFQAHSALAELQTATIESNNIQRIQKQLDCISGNVDGQLHLCHAMAKELECIGQYHQALNVLKRGNGAKKLALGYNVTHDQSLFLAIKNLFSANFAKEQTSGNSSKQPIFVLGMPRSGTTLVDRIISSHTEVVSAGELQNFAVELKKLSKTSSRQVLDIETISRAKELDFLDLGNRYLISVGPVNGNATHFIDKMPLNFLYIGLIKKALPNAKIIILNRHAMDTCLSNFRTLFAVNFSYYNYAYDLLDSGRYFSLFRDLMDFWQSLYGDSLLEMSYENLVAEPEKHIRVLLEYCGLDWQQNCLDFHNNPAPVSTASSVQVRQPINSSSIGRWQRYGDELNELQEYLATQGLF